MKKEPGFYTIFVLPGQTAHPYRFSIRRKTCAWLLGVCAVVMLLSGGLFVDYFSMLGRMADLAHLRRQTETQAVQIQNFIQTIDQFEQQMAQLSEFDRKVRAMIDLDLPPADRRLSPSSTVVPPDSVSSFEAGLGGPEPPVNLVGQGSVSGMTPWVLIEKDLQRLQTRAKDRKKSLRALAEAAEAKKTLWAATPSIWPVQGWTSSGFGERRSPFTGIRTMHHGIDIVAALGTPVIATAAGLVLTKTDKGFGNYVTIDHGRGIQTYYGHLRRAVVATGQRVVRGMVIGYVGSTGLSTGPHLHYEVQIDGRAVDPKNYILDEQGSVSSSSDGKNRSPRS